MRVITDNKGSCIEPGGHDLSNQFQRITCTCCGEDAIYTTWETLDGGCINAHWEWRCENCGAGDKSLFA